MSRSGICHERGTVHYQQTIYSHSFASMEACLAAGGRVTGGEFPEGAGPPAYHGTRPLRDYWAYAIVGAIVTVAILAAVVLPLWRRWKARQPHRAFADRERRRWEGHKLDPKEPRKH